MKVDGYCVFGTRSSLAQQLQEESLEGGAGKCLPPLLMSFFMFIRFWLERIAYARRIHSLT